MRTSMLFIFAILIACNSKGKSQTLSNNTKPSLKHIIDSLSIANKDLSLLIDKSDYQLYVVADSKVIKTYPVVFGTNPVDDKLMQGDRKTPEGKFKVRAYYPHKSWSKFIWIDYPNENSWKKHKVAKVNNTIPQDAAIGGEIGIHGVPKNSAGLIANKQNWTWGCISLNNEDIDELYTIMYDSMSIEITK